MTLFFLDVFLKDVVCRNREQTLGGINKKYRTIVYLVLAIVIRSYPKKGSSVIRHRLEGFYPEIPLAKINSALSVHRIFSNRAILISPVPMLVRMGFEKRSDQTAVQGVRKTGGIDPLERTALIPLSDITRC